ncbi:hypothetical protein EVAR_47667_1 [Eumeta japonica]|uniref:Uncharacterized protein n=1 Tax=Eumeta variegata TaxID=151549 RepID=A0A4C1XXG6_EUMVA|nr:hypothetical protein EVAR_47667_1 [Eumeta japonica]
MALKISFVPSLTPKMSSALKEFTETLCKLMQQRARAHRSSRKPLRENSYETKSTSRRGRGPVGAAARSGRALIPHYRLGRPRCNDPASYHGTSFWTPPTAD